MSSQNDFEQDVAFLETTPKNFLGFLVANRGQIESRSHLHKLCYLLQYSGIPGFTKVFFSYDLHGPYSRELSEALHESVVARIVTEIVDEVLGADEVPVFGFRYELNDHGRKFCESADISLGNQVDYLLCQIHGFPYEAICLCSSALFLQVEYGRQQEEAFHRVIDANPCFQQYYGQALELMYSLRRDSMLM